MQKVKKIAIVLGTRPEAIKLLPLFTKFSEDKYFDPILISTGQHKEMLDQVFSLFEKKPDIELKLMTKGQSLADITASLFSSLQKVMNDVAPDLVIVQGDTQTAFVAAMLAYQNRIKIAHVEAGLRTHNKFSPFPEEINRQAIGLVADYHFAPTKEAAHNLEIENKENVFMVGNTVIDSLLWCENKVTKNEKKYEALFGSYLGNKKTVLVTGHRRENFESGLSAIAGAILKLANKFKDVSFIYPVHLNPKVREVIFNKLSNFENIHLIEPVQYDELVFLLSKSYMVITDSGGIQEEAPSLDVPVLVTRDTTERPEGIKAGCARLVGVVELNIIESFEDLMQNSNKYIEMKNSQNPYGDGKTSERVLSILKDNL